MIRGIEVDHRFNWPLGKAERLARQRRLPHYLLPDGSLRFQWDDIEPLVVHVPANTSTRGVVPHA